MPQGDDLVGLGMSPQLAATIGNTFASLPCVGTGQTTAAVIKTLNTELVPSASNTGAIMQAAVKVGSPHYLWNAQSTSAVLYIPTGDTMNGTLNATFTLAQFKSAIMFKYKVASGAGLWWTLVTA